MKLWHYALGSVFIALAVLALCWGRYNRQVTALKAAGDSAQTWAANLRADADARVAYADARRAAAEDSVAKLQAASAIAHRREVAAQHRADSAAATLKQAQTAADSNPILVIEVADLRTANDNLTLEVAESRAVSVTLLNRAIADEADIAVLHTQIIGLARQTTDLNAKIQKLSPPPTLVMKVFVWTQRVLAVKGALDIARGH